MAGFVPEGEAQVVVNFSLSGDPEPMAITFGVRPDVTVDPLDIADLVYGAVTDANGLIPSAAALRVGWTFGGVTAYYNDPSGQIVTVNGTDVVGTTAGDTLPVNSAVLLNKLTGLGGRRNKGRVYLPPYSMDESQVSATGVIDSTALQTMVDNWEGTRLALETALVPMVLFHGPTVALPEPPSTLVTATSGETRIATMRTRLRK